MYGQQPTVPNDAQPMGPALVRMHVSGSRGDSRMATLSHYEGKRDVVASATMLHGGVSIGVDVAERKSLPVNDFFLLSHYGRGGWYR